VRDEIHQPCDGHTLSWTWVSRLNAAVTPTGVSAIARDPALPAPPRVGFSLPRRAGERPAASDLRRVQGSRWQKPGSPHIVEAQTRPREAGRIRENAHNACQ
jgi:hypothetical protein